MADALAYVCEHVTEIRDDLREGAGSDTGPLDRLLAAVPDGGDVGTCLEELHVRLQRDGDAQGLYGCVRGIGARLAGVSADLVGLRAGGIHRCPHRRCTRSHWQGEATGEPVCAVDGTPMPVTSPLQT
jgi:hypothetical protein